MNEKANPFKVVSNSVNVWHGFKAKEMTYDRFVEFLGTVFVPACGLLQPPVGLRAYLPTMVPQENKPDAVPDQTALMFWATPSTHDLANKAIAVRIYQNLHGHVYDMTRSKSDNPISISDTTETLKAQQSYFLLDQQADWMLGNVKHLVGVRRTDLTPNDFLASAYKWAWDFHNKPPDSVDAALICCDNDYVMAWVHGDEKSDMDTILDGLADLTIPTFHQNLSPLSLPAGLWDDWPGLDLKKDIGINMQFGRQPTEGTS